MENHIPPESQMSLETAFPKAGVSGSQRRGWSSQLLPPSGPVRPEHCSSFSCELVQARQGPTQSRPYRAEAHIGLYHRVRRA